MANLWAQFHRLTAPPALRWIATVLLETSPGRYRVRLEPSGAEVAVTGPPFQYAPGDRVIVRGTEIVEAGPVGAVLVIEV